MFAYIIILSINLTLVTYYRMWNKWNPQYIIPNSHDKDKKDIWNVVEHQM